MTRPHEFLMNTHTQRAQGLTRGRGTSSRGSARCCSRGRICSAATSRRDRAALPRRAVACAVAATLAMGLFCPLTGVARVGVSKSRRVTGLFPSAPTSAMPIGAPPVGDTAAGESAAIRGRGRRRRLSAGAAAADLLHQGVDARRAFTATGAARVPRAAGRAAGGGGRSGLATSTPPEAVHRAAPPQPAATAARRCTAPPRAPSVAQQRSPRPPPAPPGFCAPARPRVTFATSSRVWRRPGCSGVSTPARAAASRLRYARAATASTSASLSAKSTRSMSRYAACGTRRAASPVGMTSSTAAALAEQLEDAARPRVPFGR